MTLELNKIYNIDCLEGMKQINSDSIDLIVTDPPYGISFMNKEWDSFNEVTDIHDQGVYDKVKGFKTLPRNKPTNMREFFVPVWTEALRVLKPGAFAFVMCSPRQDVLAQQIVALSDAGFNTGYSSIYWTYASGFPKGQNVSKMVDKKLMYDREIVGTAKSGAKETHHVMNMAYEEGKTSSLMGGEYNITKPASEEAKKLDGSYAGFQPKPAVEVILVAMKPLSEKSYVEQALKNGKGITWLDDCRIPYQSEEDKEEAKKLGESFLGKSYDTGVYQINVNNSLTRNNYQPQQGRFTANLLVSDNYLSDSGGLSKYFSLDAWWDEHIKSLPEEVQKTFPFLYVPKASRGERNIGLDRFVYTTIDDGRKTSIDNPFQGGETLRKNTHPTVKPIALMQYLITLGSREGDLILDPFIGSGTTAIASRIINRSFIGFEKTHDYYAIATARINRFMSQKTLGEIT